MSLVPLNFSLEETLARPQGASFLLKIVQKSVGFREVNILSLGGEGVGDTVLFDRSDIRVGTQLVQVIDGELSGITVDDVELVCDLAWGGHDLALDGVDVGSTRGTLLEGDDVPAGDGIRNLRNGEEGGGRGKDGEKESGESE